MLKEHVPDTAMLMIICSLAHWGLLSKKTFETRFGFTRHSSGPE